MKKLLLYRIIKNVILMIQKKSVVKNPVLFVKYGNRLL